MQADLVFILNALGKLDHFNNTTLQVLFKFLCFWSCKSSTNSLESSPFIDLKLWPLTKAVIPCFVYVFWKVV